MDSIFTWLIERGVTERLAHVIGAGLACAAILLAAVVADLIARRVLLRAVQSLARRSQSQWDDSLMKFGALRYLAHLVPVIVVSVFAPVALAEWPRALGAVQTGVLVTIVVLAILIVNALLDTVLESYDRHPVARRVPIRTFVQAIKLVVTVIGVILVLSTLMGRSPLYFLSGLGALSAVLIIVFKDSILGFVAGIQLTANNMVAPGDWIEMPTYGADGTVLELSLTTVKVQNWDKTITTIPTYALISDSFKNWRGMEESGGRRIKRAISIDMTSVRICDDAMIERFRKFAFISDYISSKVAELERWNADHAPDTSEKINGRRMTNLGTFRTYVREYVRSLSHINPHLTFLVRQLAPGSQGVPIEVYVFSKEQRWVEYEALQADMFDHIIAVVPEFELRVFQHPTGQDVTTAGGAFAAGGNAAATG